MKWLILALLAVLSLPSPSRAQEVTADPVVTNKTSAKEKEIQHAEPLIAFAELEINGRQRVR